MILASPDGQWAAVKRGREVMLLAGGAGPATARLTLPTADTDLVLVGPPSVLAAVSRGTDDDGQPCDQLMVYMPPSLEAVARLELDTAMRISAVTGSRLVLVSLDGKAVTIVRIAGRALAAQPIDTGSPVEFVVGLDRNQVLFSLLRKLESWDAVSGRPLLRVQFPLPPPPRVVGTAHGHLWVIRPGGEDILVIRLSDSRPFHHVIGVPIDDVICHAASPLLVLVTARGLVRLHCYAHSMTVIDAPWRPGMQLGQLVIGEDVSLLGIAEHGDEPWRIPIAGAGASAAIEPPEPGGDPVVTAADKLRAMRERSAPEPAAGADRPERGPRLDLGERTRGLRLDLGDRSEPARFHFGERAESGDPRDAGQRAERPPFDFGAGSERAERSDRLDLGSRPERPERSDRLDLGPRPERSDRLDLGSRPERSDRLDLGPHDGRSDRGGRLDLGSNRDRPDLGHRPERPDRAGPDRADRLDLGHRPERPDRADRLDLGHRPDPGAQGDAPPPPRIDAMAPGPVAPPTGVAPASAAIGPAAPPRGRTWRDGLAGYSRALLAGHPAELPAPAGETELGQLAQRLALPDRARRALAALYGAYLIGEPMVPLAHLAEAVDDWSEPLGQGELGALALLRRRAGKVGLRSAVCDALDGVAPRAIRLVGGGAAMRRAGAARLDRDGRTDATIEEALASQLGRIAVIEGGAALALLEARLVDTTAVALAELPARPLPWPRGAGLVVVATPDAPAWIAALPELTAA